MNDRSYLPSGAGLHACQLAELAAVVALHGPTMVRGAPPLSTHALEQYWSASRCRLDRWGRFLKSLVESKPAPAEKPDRRRAEVLAAFEEIFVSEALTRVWTGAALAHDCLHGEEAAGPLVRNVLMGHSETRHRALKLLSDRRIVRHDASTLDRLRRRVERWIDLLVAHLYHHVRAAAPAAAIGLCELAIEPPRARDFADDLAHQSQSPGGEQAWALAMASLRAAFSCTLAESSPNADLNYALATSIIACFSPELFDSTGPFRSLWVTRLVHQTADTQLMIDELLSAEEPRGGQASGLQGRGRERRRFD